MTDMLEIKIWLPICSEDIIMPPRPAKARWSVYWNLAEISTFVHYLSNIEHYLMTDMLEIKM